MAAKREEIFRELDQLYLPHEETDWSARQVIDHLLGEALSLQDEWRICQTGRAYDAAVAGDHIALYRILLAVKEDLEQTTKAAEIVSRDQAEAQRILDAAARRLLGEELYADAILAAARRYRDALDHGDDQGAALILGEPIPITCGSDRDHPTLSAELGDTKVRFPQLKDRQAAGASSSCRDPRVAEAHGCRL